MRPAPRANYEVIEITIRDLGSGVSVTNDAEAVVRDLYDRGMLPPGCRLFYFDSFGDRDELTHDGRGGFVAFAPGPGRVLRGATARPVPSRPNPDDSCGMCGIPYSEHPEAFGLAPSRRISNCAIQNGVPAHACAMCTGTCPGPHPFTPARSP